VALLEILELERQGFVDDHIIFFFLFVFVIFSIDGG
jgi:hypothetical protein